MPFLNNTKFKEIMGAHKNGNEKASMILQALRQGSQADVDRLVGEYYSIPQQEIDIKDIETPTIEPENATPEPEVIMPEIASQVEDLTSVLDTETDGLFDENKIEGVDFSKYLSNKKRDALRSKKNSEYFKGFNPEGRANYITSKKDAYKKKFLNSIRDIERDFNDFDKAVNGHMQSVNDLLDDEIQVDYDTTNKAYAGIVDDESVMKGFGRHWDNDDSTKIKEVLQNLVSQYGKKNVMAALNTLKSDNAGFRDYKLGQINEEVERYNKSLDKILK